MKTTCLPNDNFLTRLAIDGKSDTILDSLPVGIEIYTTDGKLLYINRANASIFGADRNKVIASGINIFDSPNIPREIKDAVLTHKEIRKRFPYNFRLNSDEKYFHTDKKSVIYVEYKGRPIINTEGNSDSYIFIVEDVTEIVKKEEELHQSNLKTEIAIRDSGIMFWEFDVMQKKFYSDNEPLNFYDKTKPISVNTYKETVHSDDRKRIGEFIDRMISGENFNFTCDIRIAFPNNPEWQYCTINGSSYEQNNNGEVIKYVGTRKNNTELKKKEFLQDKILNSIPLPIHIKDIEDDFRYVFCNEESKQMFGTSQGGTTYDVMDAEKVARIEKTDKEVFATENPYFGLEHIILKDGRKYDTLVRKSIINDGNRRLLLSVRWDQSLQNDLERRSKLLSISMETMNAYSWFFEPDKNKISFGEGFDRSGRETSKINTIEKFAAAIHPSDRDLFMGTLNSTIEKNREEWNIEYRVDLNNSGVYEWWQTKGLFEIALRDDVEYKYMYGMSINIDKHKQIELTLLHNKKELSKLIRQNEMVINNINSGLVYITTDYIVQWENLSACSKSLSLGAYKRGELCYKSVHGRNSPCEECLMQRAFSSGKLEQSRLSQNGHIAEIFATPVLEDSKMSGVVLRIDDITEREQMIEEIRQARVQAEQSDKLKSAFLANMSHEIRTPLNAIVGFSELLLEDLNPEEKKEYFHIINNNNELLLRLINDILDLSKIEAGSIELNYEKFDLVRYFNDLAASMKQRITNNNIELIEVNPYEKCEVKLDKNRVTQIITNYVTNSIKYTERGFIEMGYESTGKGIYFYVRDSGIGIADDKKNKVFQRFEKLDKFAQGTGLGLSICKAIVNSMGGNVGFESEAGKGSLFWAFIPCDLEISSLS